ncbi:hypothetical protein QK357_28740 [Pseudomonas aeruginosa]|nr:hypothetical protein [Pseudomonas aeruginosa]MDI3591420.1 hypothetical protein [Pseudomonas aeruginosa]MDI3774355.1 hypothetical protein [Pseudomonas aeruginosa]MDI3799970.1 hypothetical protein [Pseudomonas aeruginosa]MDI3853138.1 hypothetical protein [Pseudomonas aeruginosa]
MNVNVGKKPQPGKDSNPAALPLEGNPMSTPTPTFAGWWARQWAKFARLPDGIKVAILGGIFSILTAAITAAPSFLTEPPQDVFAGAKLVDERRRTYADKVANEVATHYRNELERQLLSGGMIRDEFNKRLIQLDVLWIRVWLSSYNSAVPDKERNWDAEDREVQQYIYRRQLERTRKNREIYPYKLNIEPPKVEQRPPSPKSQAPP